MLTTRDLIDRMTPTALAEMIAALEQHDEYAAEAEMIDLLREVLDANVGPTEAARMIDAAR